MTRVDWTPEEEELLDALVEQHGCKWREITRHFPGRSDDSVRHTYRRRHGIYTDAAPSCSNRGVTFKRYTEEEDRKIVQLFFGCNGDWRLVTEALCRDGTHVKSVRTRFLRMVRNRNPYLSQVLLTSSDQVALVLRAVSCDHGRFKG